MFELGISRGMIWSSTAQERFRYHGIANNAMLRILYNAPYLPLDGLGGHKAMQLGE